MLKDKVIKNLLLKYKAFPLYVSYLVLVFTLICAAKKGSFQR